VLAPRQHRDQFGQMGFITRHGYLRGVDLL